MSLSSFLFFGVRKSRRRALYLLFAYQALVGVIALLFDLGLYPFVGLFLGIPAVVLAYLAGHERKLAIEALIFSIPSIILIDLVAHMSRAWSYWEESELFGIYFGEFPLIAFVWGFLYWFFIVVFYEYFFDHSSRKTIPTQEKLLIPVLFALCAVFLYVTDGHYLYVPYFYTFLIGASFMFNLVLLAKYHYSWRATFLPVIVLLLPFFLHEFIALNLDHWSFIVGNHLWYFTIPGALHPLPLEEILWFVIVNHSVILIHETLADNQRF